MFWSLLESVEVGREEECEVRVEKEISSSSASLKLESSRKLNFFSKNWSNFESMEKTGRKHGPTAQNKHGAHYAGLVGSVER
jgi:hypothetical protein